MKNAEFFESEEGDNEDWGGDPDSYWDPQDAWERSFETWMEEWVTGGATRTDILKVYAAKNGIGYRFGNSIDEVDVADATAWYEGLTIAEREDEIVGADPFNLVGLSSTDPVELQKQVALFEALNEIIEDQMDSWDDQFMSEGERFAAGNEGYWMTFGQVDYNWATDPDDVELTDEEFWEINEWVRKEIRWEIDDNNMPGESSITWTAGDPVTHRFTIHYYWGPAQTTGVNSAESFSADQFPSMHYGDHDSYAQEKYQEFLDEWDLDNDPPSFEVWYWDDEYHDNQQQ